MTRRSPPPLFACRRDRARIALRRGYGMAPVEIAALERAAPHEIGEILALPGMAELAAAHARFAALAPEAQLRQLEAVAMRLLRLRLIGGDVRAAIFFVREMRSGRDPCRTLAEAVIRGCEQEALRPRRRAADATDLRLDPVSPPERRLDPVSPPERRPDPVSPPEPAAAPPVDPVATLPPEAAIAAATDPATARAEAAREASRFEAKLAATRARLAGAVRDELARAATAPAPTPGTALRACRAAEMRARARKAAAARLAHGGRAAAPPWSGEGAEARSLARFAERSCIELRLAMLLDPRAPPSAAMVAARRLAGWRLLATG